MKSVKKNPSAQQTINDADVIDLTHAPPKDPTLSKKPLRRWWQIWRRGKKATRNITINMELRNGRHITFVEPVDGNSFQFHTGRYILDLDASYYNTSFGMNCIDYHQNFALPIRRVIPVTTIIKSIEQSRAAEVEYATNPILLEHFVTSKIAEGIMKGQAMDDSLKQIKMLVIITMIASIVTLLLFLSKSGILSGLHL